MRNSRGFTSLRTIVALIITLTLLPIACNVISYAANLKFEYDLVNDEISLYQLRRILLIAYDVENSGDSLNFIYHNDDYKLSLINNRLVLQPGYQMFLDKVDDLTFIEEGNAIYIQYEKHNKEFKTPIIKSRGIYLDDFSNTDDDITDDSFSDE